MVKMKNIPNYHGIIKVFKKLDLEFATSFPFSAAAHNDSSQKGFLVINFSNYYVWSFTGTKIYVFFLLISAKR